MFAVIDQHLYYTSEIFLVSVTEFSILDYLGIREMSQHFKKCIKSLSMVLILWLPCV